MPCLMSGTIRPVPYILRYISSAASSNVANKGFTFGISGCIVRLLMVTDGNFAPKVQKKSENGTECLEYICLFLFIDIFS